MNINLAINEGSKILKSKFISNPLLDTEILMAKTINKDRKYILLNSRNTINKNDLINFYELERQKREDERSKDRKSKIGTGDRSERIRTYNFPQGRVTDHRINLTLHKLDDFLEGEIFDEMIESLNLQAQEEKLGALN